jgi:hypothetical protein
MASRHLDLFSKHKEMNFDNLSRFHYQLISLSQLVNCVHLDLLHWRDHIPSNLKSFHEDYYGPIRIHRELGGDVLFKLLLTGRPCTLGLLME